MSLAVDRTSNFLSFSFPRISTLWNTQKRTCVYATHALLQHITAGIVHFHWKKPIRTRKAEWVVEMKFRSHPGCCRFLLISRVNTNNSCAGAFAPHASLYSTQVLHICAQISNIDSSASRILFVLASLVKPASPCHAWNKHEAQDDSLGTEEGVGEVLLSSEHLAKSGAGGRLIYERAAPLRKCNFLGCKLNSVDEDAIINVNCCFSCSVSLAHYTPRPINNF